MTGPSTAHGWYELLVLYIDKFGEPLADNLRKVPAYCYDPPGGYVTSSWVGMAVNTVFVAVAKAWRTSSLATRSQTQARGLAVMTLLNALPGTLATAVKSKLNISSQASVQDSLSFSKLASTVTEELTGLLSGMLEGKAHADDFIVKATKAPAAAAASVSPRAAAGAGSWRARPPAARPAPAVERSGSVGRSGGGGTAADSSVTCLNCKKPGHVLGDCNMACLEWRTRGTCSKTHCLLAKYHTASQRNK